MGMKNGLAFLEGSMAIYDPKALKENDALWSSNSVFQSLFQSFVNIFYYVLHVCINYKKKNFTEQYSPLLCVMRSSLLFHFIFKKILVVTH